MTLPLWPNILHSWGIRVPIAQAEVQSTQWNAVPSDHTVMGTIVPAYPPLPASPVWNTLSQGCFLPHSDTVLHLLFVRCVSLSSQIQELQCENFPARDRDMNLKTSIALSRIHSPYFIKLSVIIKNFSFYYGIYDIQHNIKWDSTKLPNSTFTVIPWWIDYFLFCFIWGLKILKVKPNSAWIKAVPFD